MISLQIISNTGFNLYKNLRIKVTRDAQTFYWANRQKNKLCHTNQAQKNFIRIAGTTDVVIAHVNAVTEEASFYLVEKLMGRLVAWFEHDLIAINIQFISEGDSKVIKKIK